MSLQDDALRLAQLDRAVVRVMLESDTEELGRALTAYMEQRQSLKARLLDESVTTLDDEQAAGVLRKISGGDGLPSDQIIERLAPHSGEEVSVWEFDDEELLELGSELFYSWYSHHEYVTALGELRPLILRCAPSDSVKRLVRQVKNCYAFQQYDAAYGLCRTLLEASIRDICERCQLSRDLGENVVLYEKYTWRCLRGKVSVSPGPLRERLSKLYGRLCEVLHARRTVEAEEAREAFRETLQVIEKLYEQHGL